MKLVKNTRLAILVVLVLILLACGSTTPTAKAPVDAPGNIATLAPTFTESPAATLQPTLTATPDLAKVFPIDNTNCRSGPSTAYPVQVSLTAGSEVKMLGRSADGEYYYVENPQAAGKGCWVKGSLVTVFGTVTIIPIFTPPAVPTVNYPTAPPAAPTAACDLSGTISIINNTGGLVTLYLTGPAKFTFKISTGSQSISVCPGTYSYTGYGCGGASKNGTVSTDTEEITFFCVTN